MCVSIFQYVHNKSTIENITLHRRLHKWRFEKNRGKSIQLFLPVPTDGDLEKIFPDGKPISFFGVFSAMLLLFVRTFFMLLFNFQINCFLMQQWNIFLSFIARFLNFFNKILSGKTIAGSVFFAQTDQSRFP